MTGRERCRERTVSVLDKSKAPRLRRRPLQYLDVPSSFERKLNSERDAEAGGDAAGRGQGCAGEEAGEVDEVEPVGDVGGLNLELQRAGFLAIELRAHP